jgi:formamidopyrimidine-DNA glycosylase
MPELPEVETMVRGLHPAVAGRMILEAQVLDPSMLQGVTADEFVRRVSGSGVAGVERRGKWVVFGLSDGRGIIVIQPRMTGGFWLVPPERADHVRLSLRTDGPHEFVWFCDTRRLGKIAWYPSPGEAEAAFRRSHGPDALEIGLTDLAGRLKGTDRAVKPALMDQKLVAGIGNIYADEILFRARIHPERKASSLSRPEAERVHESIRSVLAEAIAAEGSSFDRSYRTVLGLEGGFLAANAVYGRGGQPCRDCGTTVRKTQIPGLINRPTHFCPSCQKKRRAGPPRRT